MRFTIVRGIKKGDLDSEMAINWLKNESPLLKNTFADIRLPCFCSKVFDGRVFTVWHYVYTIQFQITGNHLDGNFRFNIGCINSLDDAKRKLSHFSNAKNPEELIELFNKRYKYSEYYRSFNSWDMQKLKNRLFGEEG